jgi:carbonic anhydrase
MVLLLCLLITSSILTSSVTGEWFGDGLFEEDLKHPGSRASSWGYGPSDGPDTWPTNFPDSCAGSSQSPIDLDNSVAVTMDPGEIMMEGYDSSMPGSVTNNGHSLTFTFDGEHTAPSISGGRLPEGESFAFAQLHWHWGSTNTKGSEHTMDGKEFPMELHLVHWNTKYADISEAVGHSDGLAVLGFFYEISDTDNPSLSGITQVANTARRLQVKARRDRRATSSGVSVPADVELNQLIPKDKLEEYFYYPGSLTTPTCNEAVLWTNFVSTVSISEAQLAVFRALTDDSDQSFNDNFRPPQPLNTRTLHKRSGHCCSKKEVGDKMYTLDPTNTMMPDPRCINGCVYHREGEPGTKFCFAPGNLPVHCVEERK